VIAAPSVLGLWPSGLAGAVGTGRCAALQVTILNPRLDPGGEIVAASPTCLRALSRPTECRGERRGRLPWYG
jgi:hypothetical protein